MKRSILKNKFVIFTLVLMGIFFVDVKGVEARSLDWNGVTVECIYTDGGLYEDTYNDYNDPNNPLDNRIVNRYTYSLKGINNDKTDANSSINYVSGGPNGSSWPSYPYDNHRSCFNYVNVATNMEKNADGDKVPVAYVAFSSKPLAEMTVINNSRGWLAKLLNIGQTTKLSDIQSYELVSENYVLTSRSGNPNSVLSYKLNNVGASEQAVSDPTTISFLVYDNAVLVQGPSRINYIDVGEDISKIRYNSSTGELIGTPPTYITLSDPEPKVSVGEGANVTYYFNSPRYEKVSSGGNRYEFFGDSPTQEPFDNGDLCVKVMPNTAKILAKVIGWCQLIVPALLIVLVALDLGKLMLAGNIDEELPKQKKRILVRFIAAIFVFFLPLVVKVALTRVKVSGSSIDEIDSIEYIDCIFEMVGI